MARGKVGMPAVGDLAGFPIRIAEDEWRVEVQPHTKNNLRRWLSKAVFLDVRAAEQYWQKFLNDAALLSRGRLTLFEGRFYPTVDAIPEVLPGTHSGQDVPFKQWKDEDDNWHITMMVMGKRYVSKWKTPDKMEMLVRKTGWKRDSNSYMGTVWHAWVDKNFERKG